VELGFDRGLVERVAVLRHGESRRFARAATARASVSGQ
jgi:hypothetical protein